MKVLLYWHDIYLPYSEHIIRAFDQCEDIDELIIGGPGNLETHEIFSSGSHSGNPYKKTKMIEFGTYAIRPRWSKFSSFKNAVRDYAPDLVIVLDEAMSINVLYAGLANYITGNNAQVVFYGFENIFQSTPLKFLLSEFSATSLMVFLRKTARYFLIDLLLQPLRKRLIHGGLYSYEECRDIVYRYGWKPIMTQQWWGINLEKFEIDFDEHKKKTVRQAAGIPGKAKLAGFVGRFTKEKGLFDLIEFLQIAPDWHLLLIGSGEIKDDLVSVATDKGVSGRLHIMPPKSQSELASIYRSMDVLVLPSRTGWFWKEQFGRVLVEAMYCEVPVVGSNSGAIPYVIENNQYVFEEGDAEGIYEAVERAVLQSKNYRNEMKQRAELADTKIFVRGFLKL